MWRICKKLSACFQLELAHSSCESFLPTGYTIIIKTFTIVPLIKPHREGVGLINTSYSGGLLFVQTRRGFKTSRLDSHVKLELICS